MQVPFHPMGAYPANVVNHPGPSQKPQRPPGWLSVTPLECYYYGILSVCQYIHINRHTRAYRCAYIIIYYIYSNEYPGIYIIIYYIYSNEYPGIYIYIL